jgi:hypothetical protein
MNQQEAKQLIDKYLKGTATPEERMLVERWYIKIAEEKTLLPEDDFEHLSAQLWQNTLKAANLRAKQKNTFRLWPAAAVAASISVFLLAGIHFFAVRKVKPANNIVARNQSTSKEILPGGNKAILILASGKQISLEDNEKGEIAKEHKTVIQKTAAGQVSYKASASDNESTFNTLITPRGGQYSVVLSDGTKVTLNAASSLKYPTNFNGSYREVELTGEGYFEVAHNPQKPFRVKSNGQTIEVLGTHFDINCYSNEPFVKTTLLQGSVKVSSQQGNVLLQPGEQSRLDVSGKNTLKVARVNTDEIIAWKDGLFRFKESSIKEVMRDAERWYNVDVSYAGNGPNIKITGSMSRNMNFSGFVKLLEFEGVKFNIKDHNVVITN